MGKCSHHDLTNDNIITGAQSSGIEFFVSPLGKPLGPVEVLERERNVEWVKEEKNKY